MKKMLSLIILAVFASAFWTGCASLTIKKVASDLKEFEQLGVKEIIVTGKFSHTDYTVEHENGKRTATINHSNAWVPQIKVVRQTDEDPK
jgi:hypothetical protein